MFAAVGGTPAGASNTSYCWDVEVGCAINNRRYCGIGGGSVFSGNGGVGSQGVEQ